MDGFKRPARPTNQRPSVLPAPAPDRSIERSSSRKPGIALPEVVIDEPKTTIEPLGSRRKKWPFAVIGALVLIAAVLVGAFMWYSAQLRPVDATDKTVQRVEIKDGSSLGFVAGRLEERGLIRNAAAFRIFVNLQGKQAALKAGTCNMTPSDSAQVLLDKMTTGCQDFKSVTFYPGATLETSLYAKTKAEQENKEFKDMSIRASLRTAGYSDGDINKAFAATYDTPLFAGKPASQDFEGYVFGETYFVDSGATAQDVLKMAFDHMYDIVRTEGLEKKFATMDFSLYEGVTMASIVGRELDCEGKPEGERRERCYGYQQQIAAVFYNRLAAGMTLGSDVTSIYASDKLGMKSSIEVDSPYNTRKYAGLTPGPIATPGKLALLAAANPTESQDLFFLAGDDGLIYFAKDSAGHEANIVNHCKIGCGSL